ncbi:high affinity cAMP-specific and IBMX-insensitive 3',5'-cyclic phosphodiesterase 8-like isoform X1 [Anopheles albimanus]|uniref:high affinity cAMP-specific and IBMX-insensitive 3',5'-cyclic phosphodiesterase 8-like isoform X1 n=1 Tax=Anopheles albimanus TaxID=7167 RepID=UPI00163E7C90|nr:high affinity cAMP-specific and IBMX-insensitive 3',5'-cyclic phosphodiesterase 8-like isoform X1 [Anopheles albimanus]XP_035786841.1 high affinity cAMP-specific and IBMX-insensitive 3',5'-cyclic phosphodiesterase 8-like isoform X1 [Anopheles albimanus]XP_035786842.1 high affinity cAMP-specific and IBMX-insensitive 3',5'-cyclic phosphodiesterase 8-like isoform X1 [Anopheles albimanus]XP_035786843.1 high affinity cAMP-specific and IBMX-insensitive 3',5'-cyclic phosphodiesterase 8-like isoform 
MKAFFRKNKSKSMESLYKPPPAKCDVLTVKQLHTFPQTSEQTPRTHRRYSLFGTRSSSNTTPSTEETPSTEPSSSTGSKDRSASVGQPIATWDFEAPVNLVTLLTPPADDEHVFEECDDSHRMVNGRDSTPPIATAYQRHPARPMNLSPDWMPQDREYAAVDETGGEHRLHSPASPTSTSSSPHVFWPRAYGRRSHHSWRPAAAFEEILEEPRDESPTRLVSDLKFPNLLPPNPAIKILIAFCKNDPVFEALVNASHRLSFEPTFVKSAEAAIDAFQNPTAGGHHIIIVDARYPRIIEAEALGRSIRNSKGSQHTTMVAVVKKSVFEKDDTAVISLLDVGYNRCIIESPHVSICSSELRQIQHSLVRPQNVISTQQALYTALHRSREAVIITDDTLRAQYANRASERVLNMKLDEIVGRSLGDLVTADISNILSHTSRYKDYDGYLTTRRKSQESSQIHVRAVPVSCIGRNPTHLVLILESSASALASISAAGEALQTLPQGKEVARGSLHSIRRPSFDVRSIASDGLRRTSLVKLSSLPLEAPITKVLSLLAQVQENCSLEEAKLLDRVMEFLKREGLYSPQMKEIRPDDPVATDLIGALLTQGPTNILSSRRSSNDSIIRGGGRPSTGSIVFNKTKESSLLSDLLHTALDWDFEIFKLEELTDKRPLVCLGLELFRRFDVYNTFNCDEMTFKLWLIEMEKNYHSENTYHNSTHAADVMQATAVYLQQLSNRELKIMDRMDEATALIAAATHDIDHPGRSSAFLCNSDDMLAVLYNDICVLESHHAATTFRLTLADDKINIFKHLDRDSYKLARSIIVDMILATEMTRHFEHLAKFVSVFGTDVESKEPLPPDNDDNQILVRRMLIKCADVSNPTRPLRFCVEWARRIAEEYFMQTDEEKRKALPIVMPMFDRTTCSISKSQIGFIEYIIHDMMDAWNSFIEMPEIIRYMEFNYSQWKLFEEQGINTLSDIKRKQLSLAEEPSSIISLEEKF